MRIVVIAADLMPDKLGGAEQHLVEVVKRLQERHTFLIFVGKDTSIQKEFNSSVKVIAINYPKVPNLYGLAYIIWGYFQIKKDLESEKVDLIWAKQVFPQAVAGALLKRSLKKPLYVTAQNPRAYIEELTLKGPIPFKSQIPKLLIPSIRFALRSADLVAAVSTYSRKQSKFLGARKTLLIPNGVDTSLYKPGKRLRGTTLKIITTSSLIPGMVSIR